MNIVIPLAKDPKGDYTALKYTLRSISQHYVKLENLIIVGPELPQWWRQRSNAWHINHPDAADGENPDTNIINKVLVAIDTFDISGAFTRMSDDTLILRRYDGATAPAYHFGPMAELPEVVAFLADPESANVAPDSWFFRFINTMGLFSLYAEAHPNSGFVPLNFDTHTPQTYIGSEFVNIMTKVPYKSGYTINSLYFNMSDHFLDPARRYALTLTSQIQTGTLNGHPPEHMNNLTALDRMLSSCSFANIQHEDDAFAPTSVVTKWLDRRFNRRSYWER